MATNTHLVSVDNLDHAPEYYEEIDHYTLDFLNRQGRPSKAPPQLAREPTPAIDPVQQLNEQLNRQYRPDLVPRTPSFSSESPVSGPLIPPTPPPPNPVLFDARAPPVKPSAQAKEPSTSVKHKLRNHIHQITAPTPLPTTPSSDDFDPSLPNNTYATRAPPQHQPSMRGNRASQYPPPHPIVSEYQPPTVNYSTSFKSNKVAPPSSPINSKAHKLDHHASHRSTQHVPSWFTTNPPAQSKSMSQYRTTQHTIDQSSKHKSKKSSMKDAAQTQRSFALYNQQNGRIEGVVKNRLNVAPNDRDGGQIVDGETTPKNKAIVWLSQPLCLGLNRLNGGLLFGTMIFLGVASFAGLIASSATYGIDSVNDAQWKILGIVVCSIMLITIIITVIIFVCCYKHGFMFNKDEDLDAGDPSTNVDADGNERQKAVLRKIYKFNRPLDTSSNLSRAGHDMSTAASGANPVVEVTDKQTNTETTIARVRPKDFDRGVWTSVNAYGGLAYRPLVPPVMTSRIVQVLPTDFEEVVQPAQVIYEVVAPVPKEVEPRYVPWPPQQTSIVEVVEAKPKASRTVVRRPQAEEIIVQPAATRIEYVDVEEPRSHRRRAQPQYEVVDEIIERSDMSSVEEIVEVVNTRRKARPQGKRVERKQVPGGVSVKHIKATDDEPYVIVKDYHS